MTKQLVLATKNRHKINELAVLLSDLDGWKVVGAEEATVGMPAWNETGHTFSENALVKAKHVYAYRKTKSDFVLADDSGLSVNALDGAPGVYSARYAGEGASDEANNHKLCVALESVRTSDRQAHFCCVLALIDDQGREHLFEGKCDGVVLSSPRGSSGFGYDPLFYVESLGKTYAELSPAEKNMYSHRFAAVRKLKTYLRALSV